MPKSDFHAPYRYEDMVEHVHHPWWWESNVHPDYQYLRVLIIKDMNDEVPLLRL